jgi:hypothetical protein
MVNMRRTAIPSVSAWSNVVIYVSQQGNTTRTQQRSRVDDLSPVLLLLPTYSLPTAATVSINSPVGESLYVVMMSGLARIHPGHQRRCYHRIRSMSRRHRSHLLMNEVSQSKPIVSVSYFEGMAFIFYECGTQGEIVNFVSFKLSLLSKLLVLWSLCRGNSRCFSW